MGGAFSTFSCASISRSDLVLRACFSGEAAPDLRQKFSAIMLSALYSSSKDGRFLKRSGISTDTMFSMDRRRAVRRLAGMSTSSRSAGCSPLPTPTPCAAGILVLARSLKCGVTLTGTDRQRWGPHGARAPHARS